MHTGHIQLEQVLPAEIENRSFEIIQDELAAMGKVLDPVQDLLIRRAIHTTADFDYADNLVFSEGAVEAGLNALREGAVIITDTNMAWSGINKKKLANLGGEAVCFMADESVAARAAASGSTRAVASMEKAAELYGNASRPCIFAIGNAPTALVRLYELVQEGRISPALIIGAPVGFVNVVPSKELILTLPRIRCEEGIKNGNWIRKEIGRSRKIHRENHNLDRCRTQFALVADMKKMV